MKEKDILQLGFNKINDYYWHPVVSIKASLYAGIAILEFLGNIRIGEYETIEEVSEIVGYYAKWQKA